MSRQEWMTFNTEYGVSALVSASFRRRSLRWRTLLRASSGRLDHVVNLHDVGRSGFGTEFFKNRHQGLAEFVERSLGGPHIENHELVSGAKG